MLRFLLIVVVALLPAAAAGAEGIVAPGAELELLAETFSFTEGPAADAQGNVFFTDQPNNKIYKWSTDGKLSVFLDEAGRANGLYFDKQGNLYAAADLKNEIWKIAPNGDVTVVLTDYQGKLLNGPNDLWIDPAGGIYFTDPLYRRDYWERDPAMQQPGQYVYYLAPDQKTLSVVINDLQQPNGIIGAPGGERLYVADIRGRQILVYDIQGNGKLGNKRVFTESGSDGMTMDEEENIYIVGNGVTVFNVKGEQIDHIEVPDRRVANVTFGGSDMSTLFITARAGFYSIKTRVRGVR